VELKEDVTALRKRCSEEAKLKSMNYCFFGQPFDSEDEDGIPQMLRFQAPYRPESSAMDTPVKLRLLLLQSELASM
jgi:hypothetical protein